MTLQVAECMIMFEKRFHYIFQVYAHGYIVLFFGIAFYNAANNENKNEGMTKKKAIVGCIACLIVQIVKYNYSHLGIILFEQIEEKYKEVDQQSKERETFFACMSHEIRNPTQAILGALELLFPEINKSNETVTLIDIAKGGCEMVLNLISNILDFTKIRANKMELCLLPCNLNQTITKIINLTKQKAESKGLYLKYIQISKEPLPPALDLDFRKLSQVIMNLICNSIKFTSNGGITVSVSWEWADEISQRCETDPDIAPEGPHNSLKSKYLIDLIGTANSRNQKTNVRKSKHKKVSSVDNGYYNFESIPSLNQQKMGKATISVADTGIGIKPENVNNLFTAFNQADSSISSYFFKINK